MEKYHQMTIFTPTFDRRKYEEENGFRLFMDEYNDLLDSIDLRRLKKNYHLQIL